MLNSEIKKMVRRHGIEDCGNGNIRVRAKNISSEEVGFIKNNKAEIIEFITNEKIASYKKDAQKIIEEAAKYTEPLMTEKEHKVWSANYRTLTNEGKEGYIPRYITVEQLEWAKEILSK